MTPAAAPEPPLEPGSLELSRYRTYRRFGHARADAAAAADVSVSFAELTDREERLG